MYHATNNELTTAVMAKGTDTARCDSAAGGSPLQQLSNKEAFALLDGAVSTGTWEASPGRFARAVVDASYFPPLTRGIWTIHVTLRKIYCIWR